MLPVLRRKSPPTFKERVELFWRWFQEAAPRFYATIEDGKCASVADETGVKIEELFPGFPWVFGPGANDVGHSFTLTGEGNIHRQLLTLEWLARAPKIAGWTFYAAKPARPIRGQVIGTGGLQFDPKEIWVTPSVDSDREHIDLVVWHPAWERIEEQQRDMVTFLFLDEALGEYGTDWWIGEVEFGRERLAAAFPLEELAEYVAAATRERGWKKQPPGEAWTLFRTKGEPGDFPRGDVLLQNTCVPELFNDYVEAAGELADPVGSAGADYVYVSIEAAHFPKGREVDRRTEIEEAIEAELKAIGGGRLVGSAFGRERMYCDYLIYDGQRSLDAIVKSVRAQKLPAGTMLEFFAREKRGRRIAL